MTLLVRARRWVLPLGAALVGAGAGAGILHAAGQDHPSGLVATLLLAGFLAVELGRAARPRLPGRSVR